MVKEELIFRSPQSSYPLTSFSLICFTLLIQDWISKVKQMAKLFCLLLREETPWRG